MGLTPDPMKLTSEQRDKLDKWNQNKQMITHLSDVADMTQEMVSLLEKESKNGEKSTKEMGALLADMRNSLSELKDKEAPESPDTAKPVVDALNKLEKALTGSIKAIDVKPNVKVDAPQVNVDTPTISVDLKGVEKILKSDIPKAFQDSISKIPKPDKFDSKPLLDAWKGISSQLESIETATRLKPQPGSTTISNLPFTPGVDANYLDVQQTSSTVETYLFKLGGSTGAVARTIVVTYTDSTKENIDTVSWS